MDFIWDTDRKENKMKRATLKGYFSFFCQRLSLFEFFIEVDLLNMTHNKLFSCYPLFISSMIILEKNAFRKAFFIQETTALIISIFLI